MTGGVFTGLGDAGLSNPYDETAHLFSILDKLEQFRESGSDKWEFKLCYPELAVDFPFPCNVWKQKRSPLATSGALDYEDVNLAFTEVFAGLKRKNTPETELVGNRPGDCITYYVLGVLALVDGKMRGPECSSTTSNCNQNKGCPWVTKVELYVKRKMQTVGSRRKKREVAEYPPPQVKIYKREAQVETEEEVAERSYGSRLTYECGLARRFQDPESEMLYDERMMQCNWNTTWTLTDLLDPCVWVACLHPPGPPEGSGVRLEWDGLPVEFTANISYTCEEGQYFEADKDLPEYNITCLETGAWDEPKEWPICLECKAL